MRRDFQMCQKVHFLRESLGCLTRCLTIGKLKSKIENLSPFNWNTRQGLGQYLRFENTMSKLNSKLVEIFRRQSQTFAILLVMLAVFCPANAQSAKEPFVEFVRDDSGSFATVTVDTTRPANFSLPPTLFGTFTENIWDAVYGGVWAQILHNPSFEPEFLNAQNTLDTVRYGRIVTDPSFGSGFVRVEPLAEESSEFKGRFLRSTEQGLPIPWEALRRAGVRYEPRAGDAANSERSLLLMGLDGREVGIRQGIYLPIHRTASYKGSLWTKTIGSQAVNLNVSIRRRDRPDEILANAVLIASSDEWKRQEFVLSLPKDKIASLEKVDFCLSISEERRLLFDNVLLAPADSVEGFDPEIIEAARALKTPLLRFGGNFVSGYHWQDGIGDPEKRHTILNQAWGLPEYNHFGTDEFIRLARLIGAEPQISVNAGSGEADEAAAWVEYCNGAPDTEYGKLRAANGHREPYNVKFWEIGNELWGDFQIGYQTSVSNARRYNEFIRAMQAKSPLPLRFIATGADVDFFREWNKELIEKVGRNLDLISTHLVIGMHPGEQLKKDADDAFTHRADFAVPVGVGRGLDLMKAQLDQNPATRNRTKIAFTEWQFWSPRPADPHFTNLGGAINSAAFFNMLARRADFVPVSNMSNLVHFAGIHRQRGRTFVTPSYYVLRLYTESKNFRPVNLLLRSSGYDVHGGNRRVPEIPDVPNIDALALISPDGKTLRVYLVNRNPQTEIPIEFNLQGFVATGKIRVRRLSADRFDRANTPENPSQVVFSEQNINTANKVTSTLPKHSLTVFDFQSR